MYYVVVALGAALMSFLAPYVWKYVSLNFLGPNVQNAILVGIGAVIGALLAERMGLKGGRGR